MPASGVRSSWPTWERNSVFMRSTSRSRRRSRSTNTPPAISAAGPRSAPADRATGTWVPSGWRTLPVTDHRRGSGRAQPAAEVVAVVRREMDDLVGRLAARSLGGSRR